jgi:hypothetical protein
MSSSNQPASDVTGDGRANGRRPLIDLPDNLTRAQLLELLERRQAEILRIEGQLGHRDQLVDGRIRTDAEWHAWRVKAKAAWRAKMAEYREIRRRLGGGRGVSPLKRAIPLLDATHGGLRALTRVYRAALAHVENDTDETFEALEEAVYEAEAFGEHAMEPAREAPAAPAQGGT